MVYEINRIEELLNFCFDFLFFNKKTSQYSDYRRYKEQRGWNWSPRWDRVVRKYFTASQLKSSGSGEKNGLEENLNMSLLNLPVLFEKLDSLGEMPEE